MAITKKTPAVKQSVGAQYICFATDIDPLTYDTAVEKSETVKNISTTENAEMVPVRASGAIYKNVVGPSDIEISTEVVAFVAETLAKMKGETTDTGGLVLSGAPAERPTFGYGKVVKLDGGIVRYEWFPKCQLVGNTDDIGTSEDSFKEQNDTLTIKAQPFDAAGNTKTYVQSDMTTFPTGLTEDEFFAKPILTPADLLAANPIV